jgi:hypothetical protein
MNERFLLTTRMCAIPGCRCPSQSELRWCILGASCEVRLYLGRAI